MSKKRTVKRGRPPVGKNKENFHTKIKVENKKWLHDQAYIRGCGLGTVIDIALEFLRQSQEGAAK